ncbi:MULTISPECIES: cyclase family protein [unclassified Ruminococcus]|uniref:cyclase family protein n=1 Tax=unclassified Ruminococcus TaxID=2608920 RepID=UPI0021092ABA|nr:MULTISPECIES: cyclase family protein [unclassified Ruminococcus]MCQ4022687.1 cyclase family protein [Ruminococcus sp. zg-924]MCQ4114927.1 cyclase family protein [Ruminococcus sp. zg-921]
MLLYDISQDILNSPIYPGDPKPKAEWLSKIEYGEEYNLSEISICTHTGTHIDSPYHYLDDGEKIGDLSLSRFYGQCTVVTISGIITGEDMEQILPHCRKKLLIRGEGEAYLTPSAVFVLSDFGINLIGIDGLSVAQPDEEFEIHRELFLHNILILEGLDLSSVEDGNYILSAFPLKLSALEASPVRAVLLAQEKGI